MTGLNETNPRNLLLVLGYLDETFTIQTERNVFSQTVNSSSWNYNQIYGSFTDGTAREMELFWADHGTEFLLPQIMQQAVQWVETAIHGQAAGNLVSNVNDLAYPLRLTWMGCMVIGWMLMLIMLGILVTSSLEKIEIH